MSETIRNPHKLDHGVCWSKLAIVWQTWIQQWVTSIYKSRNIHWFCSAVLNTPATILLTVQCSTEKPWKNLGCCCRFVGHQQMTSIIWKLGMMLFSSMHLFVCFDRSGSSRSNRSGTCTCDRCHISFCLTHLNKQKRHLGTLELQETFVSSPLPPQSHCEIRSPFIQNCWFNTFQYM